jgi:Protein of unknown function (DUF2934)
MENPPPLIVADCLADERLWAEVLNLGGYDLLAKPFDANGVLQVVSAACRRWEDEQGLAAHRKPAMSAKHGGVPGTHACAAPARLPQKRSSRLRRPAAQSTPFAETATSGSAPEPEQIARLAYSYWQARGRPEGSSEENWLRAEAELRKQTAGEI